MTARPKQERDYVRAPKGAVDLRLLAKRADPAERKKALDQLAAQMRANGGDDLSFADAGLKAGD